MNSKIEVSVIGSGPAGLTAAIYSARAGLKTVIFGGPAPLGQLMYTTHVENFPGFEQITGPQLMENMKNQAIKLGVDFLEKKIESLELGNNQFTLRVGATEYKSQTCILATGSEAKWLGLESENRFRGAGVSTCATCDGFFYKGKVVAVVGGGNTAVEDALTLAKIASKVILIHRRDTLRAEKIMQDRLFEQEKVEFVWNSEVQEFYGQDDVLTSILVKNNQTGELSNIAVDGVFIAIGHTPQTDLVKGILELDELGYVKTGPITNVSGLFVAGDVHDSVYRQAITAAGDGCKAALEASKLIASEEKSCVVTPVPEVYKQSDYRSLFKVEPAPKRKSKDASPDQKRSYSRKESDNSSEKSFRDKPDGFKRSDSKDRDSFKPRDDRGNSAFKPRSRSGDGERRFRDRAGSFGLKSSPSNRSRFSPRDEGSKEDGSPKRSFSRDGFKPRSRSGEGFKPREGFRRSDDMPKRGFKDRAGSFGPKDDSNEKRFSSRLERSKEDGSPKRSFSRDGFKPRSRSGEGFRAGRSGDSAGFAKRNTFSKDRPAGEFKPRGPRSDARYERTGFKSGLRERSPFSRDRNYSPKPSRNAAPRSEFKPRAR